MRDRVTRVGLVLLWSGLWLPAQFPPSTEQKCGLEGQVLNSTTGEPVRKAHVTLMGTDTSRSFISSAPGSAAPVGAVTDAQGRFTFAGIAPGRYQLIVHREGFIDPRYGKARWQQGDPLTLTAGEQKRDVVMRLTPLSAVSGHILDEDGDPVQNVQVSLMVYQYTQKGRQLTPNHGASSNDLGEYRIFGVIPGRYYFKAIPPNMQGFGLGASETANDSYATAYYPGSPDAASASAIEVAPGQQLLGIDMTLRRRHAVSIRGRAIKPDGGSHMTLALSTTDEGWGSSSMGTGINDREGKFELHGIAPGLYALSARSIAGDKPYSARIPIQVGSTDIDGIELHLVPPIELAGTVRIEGKTDVKPSQVNLQFEGPGRGHVPEGAVKEDGAFALKNLEPGVYHFSVFAPGDLYLKAIRWGDTDVIESGLDLSSGVSASDLIVVLSANGGQIEGSVENDKSEPATSVLVTLVPPSSRRVQSFFKVGGTDLRGHFSIHGIAPGSYKLFAWEEVDSNAVQYDPEFLQPYDSMGQRVQISENGKENVHLKLIAKPSDK